MPNIYTVKFDTHAPVSENLEKMKRALDNKVPFMHCEVEQVEQTIMENYILENKDKESAIETDKYMVELNKNTLNERISQARAIIVAFANAAGNLDKLGSRLESYTTMTGQDFMDLINEYGPSYYTGKENELLIKSTSVGCEVDPEVYKANVNTIEFNDDFETEDHTELMEKANASVIKALGFEKSDIDSFIETIKNSNNDKKVVGQEFNKLITKQLKKVPADSRCEEQIYDISNGIFKVFDCYAKERMDSSIAQSIKDHVKSNEFQDFAIKETSPKATASIIKENVEGRLKNYDKINANDDLDLMLRNIKHLEYVHSKRSLFTRFVDWFRSDGENSTINKLKEQIIAKGHTKEEIEETLKSTSSEISTRYDHTTTLDNLAKEMDEDFGDHLGAYGYLMDDARSNIYASRDARYREAQKELSQDESKEDLRKRIEVPEASETERNPHERESEEDSRSLDDSFEIEDEPIDEGRDFFNEYE